MSKQIIPLTANQVSAPITVPALKIFGVVTDFPVSIRVENKAQLCAPLGTADTKAVFATSDTITFTAGPAGASVILNTDD